MADYSKQLKGDNVKTIIIIVLVAFIIILFYSDTLTETTKRNFYYLLAIVIALGLILYILNRKRKLDIFQVAKDVINKEYAQTGISINIKDLNVDVLDTETLVIGFKSGGELVSYKWDRTDNVLIARLSKKIDEIKSEVNNSEISRLMSQQNINKGVSRRKAEEEGFDIVEQSSQDEIQ